MEKTNWSIHIHLILTLVFILWGFFGLYWAVERLTTSITSRTDHMYEMFIDLLKEKR
jgi:hypothetical protein